MRSSRTVPWRDGKTRNGTPQQSLSDLAEIYVVTTATHAVVVGTVVRPDLALLDVVLPRSNGFAVLRALRTIPGLAPLPAIMITGSARADVPVQAMEVGAQLLFKPLDPDALRDTVLLNLPAVSGSRQL